jgi:hypothetical protein
MRLAPCSEITAPFWDKMTFSTPTPSRPSPPLLNTLSLQPLFYSFILLLLSSVCSSFSVLLFVWQNRPSLFTLPSLLLYLSFLALTTPLYTQLPLALARPHARCLISTSARLRLLLLPRPSHRRLLAQHERESIDCATGRRFETGPETTLVTKYRYSYHLNNIYEDLFILISSFFSRPSTTFSKISFPSKPSTPVAARASRPVIPPQFLSIPLCLGTSNPSPRLYYLLSRGTALSCHLIFSGCRRHR